jgi:hypothetical protein
MLRALSQKQANTKHKNKEKKKSKKEKPAKKLLRNNRSKNPLTKNNK